MTLPVGHERGASLHVVWIEANGAFARLVEGGLEAVGFSMVSWSEADTDRVRFDEFFALEGDARARLAQVQDLLLAWSEGEHWKAGVHRLPVCDWSEAWKRFFHTERISARIVVKPSWERYEPEVGDCVVELDPGMSFGTGLHPTTRACLRFLDQQGLNRPGATFLDIGCGSGILAIAAGPSLSLSLSASFGPHPNGAASNPQNANPVKNALRSTIRPPSHSQAAPYFRCQRGELLLR